MTTFNIHVHTAYRENYGTAEAPYWKSKGGATVVLTGFNHPLTDGIGAAAAAAVAAHAADIEIDNSMAEEHIIDWEFVAVDALTPDEKDQMEFEGRIVHPARRIALGEAAS